MAPIHARPHPQGLLFMALLAGLLVSGCLEPRPLDREPDAQFEGQAPTSIFDYPGHTFTLPPKTNEVLLCVDTELQDARYKVGPYGPGAVFTYYQERKGSFCGFPTTGLEHREWSVYVDSSEHGPYGIRLWYD